jgi:hypothetical protein
VPPGGVRAQRGGRAGRAHTGADLGRRVEMEPTGRDRSLIVPLLLGVAAATMVSRSIELRSICDARLTDDEVQKRVDAQDPA